MWSQKKSLTKQSFKSVTKSMCSGPKNKKKPRSKENINIYQRSKKLQS